MKAIFKGLACAGVFAAFTSVAPAATMTMTGTISDSMCGASHAKMMEMHKDAKMTDRDCTLACVKGGGKYVFVSDGKVYQIANQDLPDLQKAAGGSVQVTGDVKGDSVTVSKFAPGKRK
jgi:hypothetical protein